MAKGRRNTSGNPNPRPPSKPAALLQPKPSADPAPAPSSGPPPCLAQWSYGRMKDRPPLGQKDKNKLGLCRVAPSPGDIPAGCLIYSNHRQDEKPSAACSRLKEWWYR
ncbi:hypothetical protein GX51_00808 [Blastomyces parvus]|uniref:Uncharacterized protein n=1 Tax=Blastomyces parvus TaxID=2060905 RepID=A0A2B7XKA7_9EURO|nr:hypothetical protein GX51_00808 [Blastomyces parvus]